MGPVALQIYTIESEPFAENSYIVWDDERTDCFVIDPGFEPEVIVDFLQEQGLTPVAILNTHGHCDHIAGNRAMTEAYPDLPIYIGENDAVMLVDPRENLSEGFGIPITSPSHTVALRDSERHTVAGITWDCWHTPGHSPGHIVYFLAGAQPRLFGGDVLFRGSVGRTDFPHGSFPQLLHSIQSRLWPLPGNTVVYPGHGPVTTIAHEQATNPYTRGRDE
ncbi:MAG: MBL fold metallo-hydrolase [Gemmataceae bacterium]